LESKNLYPRKALRKQILGSVVGKRKRKRTTPSPTLSWIVLELAGEKYPEAHLALEKTIKLSSLFTPILARRGHVVDTITNDSGWI
jgi:hypothetical protein